MSSLSDRLARLTPEQRLLLERRLQKTAATPGKADGGRTRSLALPPALTASPPALLLAGLAVLLHRLNGEARPALGLGSSAVAVDLTGDPPFSALLERVQAALGTAGPGEPLLGLEEGRGEIVYDAGRLEEICAQGLPLHLVDLLAAAAASPDLSLSALPLYGDALRPRFFAAGARDGLRGGTFPELFAEQAAKNPGLPAVSAGGRALSYREVDERSNRLARFLLRRGLALEDRVALALPLSAELIVALLAVLKAGGSVVPVGGDVDGARLSDVLDEIRPAWLLTNAGTAEPGTPGPHRIEIDSLLPTIARESADPLPPRAFPESAALALPGTTPPGGRRWVLLPHAGLLRVIRSLDEAVGCGPGDSRPASSPPASQAFLAEALWPLTRGAEVVLSPAPAEDRLPGRPRAGRKRPISFSLFYFSSAETARGDRWRLLFDGARFADRHGFEAVWTPERHFHPFGGLFPNPAMTSAALAMITERVHLRAGSVVLPLHHPVRVAEDWSLVDNYSRGRAGIAFASGWHADDFVFFPDHYAERREVMFQGVDTIRRLWRGEAVPARGGVGQDLAVRIYPRPVQPELPVWITAAATSNTLLKAGEIGANVLANLLGQSLDTMAGKVRQYREARGAGGHDPETGRFTLMLHTFVGDDLDVVRETVRTPFSNYIRSFGGLLENLARSRRQGGEALEVSEEDKEQALSYAFQRYFQDNALFGTPDTCLEMIRHLEEIGVDEVACLIDFGIDLETTFAGLDRLSLLQERARRSSPPPAPRPELPIPPGTVLLDCRKPFSTLPAGPGSRALRFQGAAETGGWSSLLEGDPTAGTPPVLRPLAGMELFVLREDLEPAPIGVPGELCVQGDGPARGYVGRPDRTAARFLPSPFGARAGERLVRTGHAARYRPDGGIEWIGLYGESGEVMPLSPHLGAGAVGRNSKEIG